MVVVGTVETTRKIDTSGWAGTLKIDRVIAGKATTGTSVDIAWEELAFSRQVRFDEGERVLVVLGPLPPYTLWKKRFPNADREHPVYAVANKGDAFLRSPDGTTLNSLEHYFAMVPEARKGAPGISRLAEMVASAELSIALEALELLESATDVAGLLGDDGGTILLQAARRDGRDPGLRSRALLLAAKSGLRGTKEAALALTEPGSVLRADAYRALAILPHGLTPQQALALLDDQEPEVRVVGVGLAGFPDQRERVTTMARKDTSPSVRLAAGTTLLLRLRAEAVPSVIPMLDDEDPTVRLGIAEGLGNLGEPAVAPLRDVVEKGSEQAALTAIPALAATGKEGALALTSIANLHPSEKIRAAANLAMGKGPPKRGHTH